MIEDRIFCDMDGVLADFHAGALRLVGKDPVTTPAHRKHPFQCSYAMEAITGCPDIWQRIKREGPAFWADLPLTTWAHDLMDVLLERGRVTILTNPGGTCAEEACAGKLQWLRKHFNTSPRDVIFAAEKHLSSGLDRFLVDDMQENCDDWTNPPTPGSPGGIAVLVPQPWNSRWQHTAKDVVGLVSHALGCD